MELSREQVEKVQSDQMDEDVRKLDALYTKASRNIQEWLTELTVTSEPECVFILYAKSFLNSTERQHLSMASNQVANETEQVLLDNRSSLPPKKPQRCIARMISPSSGHVLTASTPAPVMNNAKYRTTVCYRLDETPVTSTRCSPTSLSAFIRVKSCNDSGDSSTRKNDKLIQLESKCDYGISDIPNMTPGTSIVPIIPPHNARAGFCSTDRSLTPKISTRGYGYRYRMCRKSQRRHRLSLQQLQKQKQNESVISGRKSSNKIKTTANGTVVAYVSHSDTSSVCSPSELLPLKTDTNERISKTDDTFSSSTEQHSRSSNLTCSKNQSNLAKQSSPHFINVTDILDSSDNRKLVRSMGSDFSLTDSTDQFENFCKVFTVKQNDSQISNASSIKFNKPSKATILGLRKVKPSKTSDSLNNRNRDQLTANKHIRLPYRAANSEQVDSNCRQLKIFRVNGQTTLQVLLDAPTSSELSKSISNVSRCSGNDVDDGTAKSASPGRSAVTTSSTNSSTDSGQGSAEVNFQNPSFNCDQTFSENSLPSYARMANTIDHVLRVSSTLHSVLNDEINEKCTNDLVCETKVLIATIQCSPCFAFLSVPDITTIQRMICDLESKRHHTQRPVVASKFLIVLLEKTVNAVLIIFARIISAHLSECTSRDRLLVIALEHLIHLMLFGDEICITIIQCGGLDSLLYFCEVPSIPNATLQLLLRGLAVLCGNYRGAVKLLALNKFELIIQLLFTSTIACSAEAAGILTQLTNPTQNYVRLGNMMPRVIIRILEIVDKTKVAESLLLAIAALANIAIQENGAIDILYEHNAIRRLVQAYKRPKCHNVYIQEQLLTVFMSLANGAYIEALIGQGAVDLLLLMLKSRNRINGNCCRRIQVRAAQCLRIISNHGIGLKAIHEMSGYSIISEVIQDNDMLTDARSDLCWITEQMEKKYHLESAV
uniref:Protein inscuteable homologue C-terminal domain-containing protein n=1 Tax=Setaria digitata TaxID=48799 RepID=A0A915Q4S0_9BILA